MNNPGIPRGLFYSEKIGQKHVLELNWLAAGGVVSSLIEGATRLEQITTRLQ